ncbi:conserved hypothetical protein [Methanococcus aeolicus Nankai-3]|jgi:hypothetical protein|uniref:Lipoprotein n=1 Tax=Methanococcus aeolicus (strain ATCC BAA-1280 / DSM 17508 / OCM 812 / Nankai-3) TaxID=419665 RepID=A6UVP9_META3|nr:hypothetical protein [Methanococcus aeolicus]ABR56571.1 conserved hypothetical protein [Methanococcus aeolicus Nankai-3]
MNGIKKISLLILSIILIGSMAACVEKKSTLYDYGDKNTIFVDVNNQSIQLELRTTVGEALTTKLVNTNIEDIKNDYNNNKIIYIEYDPNISQNDGGVSIIDLVSKLKFYNSFVKNNMQIVDSSVFTNQSEIDKIKNSKITMIVKITKSNSTATISKSNGVYVIEGNSLKELDKATTMFVLSIYTNPKDRYYLTI